jgi:hypothetical protein
MAATMNRIVKLMRAQPLRTDNEGKVRVNDNGNLLHDAFLPEDRYIVDFAPDFTSEGWMQFDTNEDAHYFGVWMNPSKRLTLTYAEGDWTLVWCPDAAGYNAEVLHACEFYGTAVGFKSIDLERKTETWFIQDRKTFLQEVA